MIFFAESCYKNNNVSYVAKVSGKIFFTALIFYDTLQTIEQSIVVALVTFSLLLGLSRNNRNTYLISFSLQLTCIVSSSSSSVKISKTIFNRMENSTYTATNYRSFCSSSLNISFVDYLSQIATVRTSQLTV